MAYQTSNTITTTKSTVYDKSTDKVGPIEWEFIASGGDINLYLTGVFPGPTVAVVVSSGETYKTASVSNGITKIEADVGSGTATLTIRPTINP